MIAILGSLVFATGAAVLCDRRTASLFGVADCERSPLGWVTLVGGAAMIFVQSYLWFGPAA